MIDHVSIGVRDLARSTRFYEGLLATLGHRKLVERPNTVGFGKTYPEFWLNSRPSRAPHPDSGNHVCLRAKGKEQVEAFHEYAIGAKAESDGAPGFRPEYHETYFAAFVRDFDGNCIEVVTFVDLET